MQNVAQQKYDFYVGLNEFQQQAVGFNEGLCAVIGNPGSGKTSTIVHRVGRLIQEGVNPDRIMAMTFTKKAAAEMNMRLARWGIETCRVGTIHSVCMQIAAAETNLMQCTVDAKDKLQWDLKRVLNDMRREKAIPNRGVDYEGVKRCVSSCKATGLCYIDGDPFWLNPQGEQRMLWNAERWSSLSGLSPRALLEVYRRFERKRATKGLMGFDDMLLWAWTALVYDAEARYKWRSRWDVVIVDEAQDSNPIQWDISRLLVGLDSCIPGVADLKHAPVRDEYSHNLMTVGDSSQAIYSFRDASPELFVEFSKDAGTTLIVLPINYRSNQTICNAGFSLVKGWDWHLGGAMESANGGRPDDAISVVEHDSSIREASSIIEEIQEMARFKGYKSCAILSRLRVGLDLFELECIRKRIRYVKVPQGSFLESKEVKDVLGYLRVAACLDDTGEWIRHIVNRPFRYFSKVWLDKCSTQAQEECRSLLDVMNSNRYDLNRPQRIELSDLCEVLMNLNKMAVKMQEYWTKNGDKPEEKSEGDSGIPGPADMVLVMLKDTDYIEALRREEGLMGMDESKKAMLSEIIRIARHFKTVYDFLVYINTLTIAIKRAAKSGLRVRDESKADDYLTLSTIHSAKGLEWEHVFIVDVVQGRFPCSMADDFDEELRLMYVAVTRAMHTCKVSYTRIEVGDDLADTELGETMNRIIMSPFVRKLNAFKPQGCTEKR